MMPWGIVVYMTGVSHKWRNSGEPGVETSSTEPAAEMLQAHKGLIMDILEQQSQQRTQFIVCLNAILKATPQVVRLKPRRDNEWSVEWGYQCHFIDFAYTQMLIDNLVDAGFKKHKGIFNPTVTFTRGRDGSNK